MYSGARSSQKNLEIFKSIMEHTVRNTLVNLESATKHLLCNTKLLCFSLWNRLLRNTFQIYKCITKYVFRNRLVNPKTCLDIPIPEQCFLFFPLPGYISGKGVLRLIKDNIVHTMKTGSEGNKYGSAKSKGLIYEFYSFMVLSNQNEMLCWATL